MQLGIAVIFHLVHANTLHVQKCPTLKTITPLCTYSNEHFLYFKIPVKTDFWSKVLGKWKYSNSIQHNFSALWKEEQGYFIPRKQHFVKI